MALYSQEHYDLMEQFERDLRRVAGMPAARVAKEPKDLWKQGNIYQDGATNQMFLAYRLGHAYGKASAAQVVQ